MMRRLLTHARANLIGYVALFVALGGTSYAAVSLAPGSVGTRQIQNGAVTGRKLANGAVTPAKLQSRAFGGVVRHWAQVSARGRIVSASERARDNGLSRDGDYVISWGDSFPSRCIALATSAATGSVLTPTSGYANTKIAGRRPTDVIVNTYNAQGQPSPAAFSVAVIC